MAASAVSSTKSTSTEDSFSKSVVLIASLMIAQRLIGFARSFFVCDVLSPAEVGQWDLAFGFLMLVAPLAVLGIPGSFGRYISHFQKRGMSLAFFKQSLIATLLLAILAGSTVVFFRAPLARFAFGTETSAPIVAMLGFGLPIVIVFNFGSCWFSGLRLNRVVIRIQFVQVLFFFLLCVLFLTAITPQVENVIWAYLLSCLFAACLGVAYLASQIRSSPEKRLQGQIAVNQEIEDQAPHGIWSKVLPFAAWVWVSNALINLFAVCDRLLIVNCSNASPLEALNQVGQYHSARILPMILIAIGGMAGSMVTPYLSKDWESGRRTAVDDRLNLMIKLMIFMSFGMAVFVYLAAPLLFQTVWQNKFSSGQSLLPMTLTFCSFAGLTLVSQKYFWCIEKTSLSGLALAIGLTVNLAIGLALIPRYGIEGVVVATLIGHVVVFALVIGLAAWHGFQIDRRIFLIVPMVFLFCAGPMATLIGFMLLIGLTLTSSLVFSPVEKLAAVNVCRNSMSRFGFKSFDH